MKKKEASEQVDQMSRYQQLYVIYLLRVIIVMTKMMRLLEQKFGYYISGVIIILLIPISSMSAKT